MSGTSNSKGLPFAVNSTGDLLVLSGGTLFKKELLAQGRYQHPTRPWKTALEVDEGYIDALVATTNEGIKQGVKVPVPLGHDDNDDPEKNRGFLTRAFKGTNERGLPALFGDIEITNPEAAERVGRDLKDVSVYIDDWGSGQWTPESDRIVHVALTNYPVYAGQDNFQRLSARDGVESRVPVLRYEAATDPKEITMKLSANQREALAARGIALDQDEPTMEDAVKAVLSVEQPKPAAPVTADDVPRLLSVDPAQDRYFGAWHKGEADRVTAEVAVACTEGRLSAEMAEAATSLLSVSRGYGLSAEGKAEAVEVAALVRKILSGIPAHAVVPLKPSDGGKDLAASAAGAPPVEPKEFGAKDVDEVSKRMLARVQAEN